MTKTLLRCLAAAALAVCAGTGCNQTVRFGDHAPYPHKARFNTPLSIELPADIDTVIADIEYEGPVASRTFHIEYGGAVASEAKARFQDLFREARIRPSEPAAPEAPSTPDAIVDAATETTPTLPVEGYVLRLTDIGFAVEDLRPRFKMRARLLDPKTGEFLYDSSLDGRGEAFREFADGSMMAGEIAKKTRETASGLLRGLADDMVTILNGKNVPSSARR